jgi:hypothetical protein
VKQAEVVCVGVAKRVAAAAFVAFEFRFRAIADAAQVKAGQRLVWSAVFPLKPGMDIPPEGFLHLPQKQKFNPFCLLDRKAITIMHANLASDDSGDRLSLTDQSTVTPGAEFKEWNQFLDWSPEPAVERIRQHRTGPLDLDTELLEEIALDEYAIGEPAPGDSQGQTFYPITAGKLSFTAVVSSAADGKQLRTHLDELKKQTKNRPPLFGLLHYERCRLMFQPLTTFQPEPEYLTISKENVNKAALLKALNFT